MFALFFTKNKTIFTNKPQNGLVYNGNERLSDLVNRDTDGDGVPDWQEGLYGTDPTKKISNPNGIPDNLYIARMQTEAGNINLSSSGSSDQNLTQTDKFSRELFSTVATLNQTGSVDQDTVDKLTDALAGKIQNSTARKVFLYSNLKIGKSDDRQAIVAYNNALNAIYSKYPMKNTVIDVMQKFVVDDNAVDESVLPQLDPIIKQTNNIIGEMAKMSVPPSLALLHLEVLNKLEKVLENVIDIRQYDADIVVAMSGISQYQASSDALVSSTNNLASAIENKLR